ncbi:MAG TPA: DUF4157 domain-containing protein, partial [Gemmatimonadaceae bacterium]|nr:DUF4157 domain-containing protein [Gemmatimonadaceae bacterium]
MRTFASRGQRSQPHSTAQGERHATSHRSRLPVPRHLEVGAPNDDFEQAADRIARHVAGASSGRTALPSGGAAAVTPLVRRVLDEAGEPLDSSTRAFMEPRLGRSLANVRVHADSRAARSALDVAADAYTVGDHIVFGAGLYAPYTSPGRQLLAHEIAHTMQRGAPATLRRQPSGASKDTQTRRFVIKIPAGITTVTQWERYIEIQILGRVTNSRWKHNNDAVNQPAKNVGKPINVRVQIATLEKFGVGEGARDPKAAKAEKVAAEKEFKGLSKSEQDAINKEIDERYFDSTQETPGALIKRGETGKAIIWNNLKQEVLADRKALAQLPQTVKSLLGESNFVPENYQVLVQLGAALSQLSDEELKAFFVAGPNGAQITPADYPQLLSIAKKLAALSPEARKDYLARVSASTASLDAMERSIDNYVEFRARREKEVAKHEEAAKPLLGGEDVYTLYRGYLALKSNVALARGTKGLAKDKAEAEESYEYLQDKLREREAALLTALKHKGFDSIAAFEAAIES